MNRLTSWLRPTTCVLAMAAITTCVLGCASSSTTAKKAAADDCSDCCAAETKPAATATSTAPAADAKTETPAQGAAAAGVAAAADETKKWTVLFDGKSLDGWTTTMFGGNDDPSLEDGEMIVPAGATLGGVNYSKPTPVMNYEVEVVGRRRNGTDFWCGLTVPVGEMQFVTLVLGGWGGSLCGISSIDGMDASENNTTSHQKFEKGKFYTARLRVLSNRLQAWLDEKPIVDEETTDRRLSIRIEVSKSKPFGIATWQTEGGIKSVKVRELTSEEIAAAGATAGGKEE